MNTLEIEIEKLIDAHGIENFIDAFSRVCFEKADHILANYNDQQLATSWKYIGRKIARIPYKGKKS